jgi:polyhydroxyalkanoate synthase subunit PhaC
MASPSVPATIVDRIRREVGLTSTRARNGLLHLAGTNRPDVGCSPKEVVWERDKAKLYRYHSTQRRIRPPLLLVMSLVSKPYVLDLRPGNSFIEALVARGFDVYSLDWGIPDAVESQNSFETYCDEYLPLASVAVLRESEADQLTVFGYCFGGVLSLLFAAGHPEIPIRSLAVMATPIDFTVMGSATALLRDGRLDPTTLLDETGNVPARAVFDSLKTLQITGEISTYAALLNNLDSVEYIAAHEALNGWATDHIPFPGACFLQTAEWFMKENRLAENRVVTRNHHLDIGAISCPVLNVVGDADHIVPLASNLPIRTLLPDADDLHFKAGHVGLIIGRTAQRTSIPGMADWMEKHSVV